jgi:bile acid:Na+ symporter, BASS family
MAGRKRILSSCQRLLHEHFLWFLLAAYLLAACCPAPGLWLRGVSLAETTFGGEHTQISLPMVMLAFLLLNAGLGVRANELRHLGRSPLLLLAGLAANMLVPVAFIFLVSQGMRRWHNGDEVQTILVGLALVAAMPIAGSSTAWSQGANGDMALGLGLVLVSTVLSPLTTPLTFGLVEQMATGEFAQALAELEGRGTGTLLMVCVLLPSLLGMAARPVVGAVRLARAKPVLKLAKSVTLLLLNYSNASVSLPLTLAEPDWDFLAVTLAIVGGLCAVAFGAGWAVARLLQANAGQQAALMFGLGMNNNGTGLVLASLALARYPRVLLPIIFYNLVQHLAAGVVHRLLSRTALSSAGFGTASTGQARWRVA